VLAWDAVRPNFLWGGVHYSKLRYRLVWKNGKRHLLDRFPDSDPDRPTYEWEDWEQLRHMYLYWRRRLIKAGVTGPVFTEEQMAMFDPQVGNWTDY